MKVLVLVVLVVATLVAACAVTPSPSPARPASSASPSSAVLVPPPSPSPSRQGTEQPADIVPLTTMCRGFGPGSEQIIGATPPADCLKAVARAIDALDTTHRERILFRDAQWLGCPADILCAADTPTPIWSVTFSFADDLDSIEARLVRDPGGTERLVVREVHPGELLAER